MLLNYLIDNEKLKIEYIYLVLSTTSKYAKIQKHQAFEAEVSAHANAILALDEIGNEMIIQGHFASEIIRERLDELHRLWALLLSKLADKGTKLQQALKLVQFMRECREVMFWINDKDAFVTSDEFGTDLEHVEVLQKKFDEFQKDLQNHEDKVAEVNNLAEQLVADGHPEEDTIRQKQQEVNEAWHRLRQLSLLRQERLFGAHEIQRFNRDADETISWIQEKDTVLSTDDYGRDLASVQTLQRKHEGVERDLAALEEKSLFSLISEANCLQETHPEQAGQIQAKQKEIGENWKKLKTKATERKTRLDDAYYLQRFLADFRDLVSWITDMKAIISADELAKDVSGAEALLDRHNEHKGEIDAREDSFQSATKAGTRLVESNHFASDEVREKLNTLNYEKHTLLELWEERRVMYEQCMDLQLFLRDTEQADTWMTKQEAFLVNDDLGDSLDSVEALLKKHGDFEKSLAAQEEKIKALDEFATKLIDSEHYASEDVAARRDQLLARRNALYEKSNARRYMLEQSYEFQIFERDCDETKGWINEKLKAASDENYLDPTNLQTKLQKHQNFEAEKGNTSPIKKEQTRCIYLTMQAVHFSKYHGAGNDFIAIDNRKQIYDIADDTRRHMCDRHFGIGADGIIEIKLSQTAADFAVIYYNCDGQQGSLCGNGCRCALAFVHRLGLKKSVEDISKPQGEELNTIKTFTYEFEASDGHHIGTLTESVVGGSVSREYSVKFRDILSTEIKQYNEHEFFLDTGSPHHVTLVSNAIKDFDVVKEGRKLRYGLYGERGSNINFVNDSVDEVNDNGAIVMDTNELKQSANAINDTAMLTNGVKDKLDNLHVRTYERGVEGETLACGTGAVAVAVIHCARKANMINARKANMINARKANMINARKANVINTAPDIIKETFENVNIMESVRKVIRMKGGTLTVTFGVKRMPESSAFVFHDITLSGSAEHVFDGVYNINK
ncbi:hypothetical protein Btru_004017 [Bulinus truncatus]|nr:hypothetical protein Btru_004017 [Bulinus truncatus]